MGNNLGYHDHVLVGAWPSHGQSIQADSLSVSYGTSKVSGTAAFRLPWVSGRSQKHSGDVANLAPKGLQMIPGIGLFIGMMFLPESPRWLARKDRWEEAHDVLTLVHGNGDPNSPFVMRELQEIKDMVEFERNNSDVSYLELFKPHMINRTHIGLFTQIWSQLTGMNVMSMWI